MTAQVVLRRAHKVDCGVRARKKCSRADCGSSIFVRGAISSIGGRYSIEVPVAGVRSVIQRKINASSTCDMRRGASAGCFLFLLVDGNAPLRGSFEVSICLRTRCSTYSSVRARWSMHWAMDQRRGPGWYSHCSFVRPRVVSRTNSRVISR
jgi:hypothetical protein